MWHFPMSEPWYNWYFDKISLSQTLRIVDKTQRYPIFFKVAPVRIAAVFLKYTWPIFWTLASNPFVKFYFDAKLMVDSEFTQRQKVKSYLLPFSQKTDTKLGDRKFYCTSLHCFCCCCELDRRQGRYWHVKCAKVSPSV